MLLSSLVIFSVCFNIIKTQNVQSQYGQCAGNDYEQHIDNIDNKILNK